MRKTVTSGSHLEELIGFSRACRVGNYISFSGTAPINNGETLHIGDIYHQTKYSLELSIAAIEEAGGNVKNVIRPRIMLTDISR
ncbi:Rid family hydrolase [Pseudoalteromonas byunsanensis]|uniref:Rid family hydrolase n=1 Tax=Pseudoalteromonas byunsanensis TaxID=327939 RepID=UPI001C30AD7C|nr:Rid family hydrolase [Pseudoalteromonas byunsanensis]